MKAGTLPVTSKGCAAVQPLRCMAGSDLEEDAVATDEQDEALACERCDRDRDDPELGLAGNRKWRGGRARSDEREEGSECDEEALGFGLAAAALDAGGLRAAARELMAAGRASALWLAPKVNQEEK